MTEALSTLPSPPSGLVWRRLGLPHLNAIEALHHASITSMGVEAVKLENRTFFESLLRYRGLVIGLLEGANLIAYGILQHNLKAGDSPLSALGLPAQTLVRKLSGASVAKEWRGRGLQRLLIEARLRLADDAAVVFSTSAPSNLASWSNLLACGLTVRAIQHLYGGHPRYIMVRVTPALDDRILYSTQPGEDLDYFDLERQSLLLTQGWRGIGMGDTRTRFHYQPTLPGRST